METETVFFRTEKQAFAFIDWLQTLDDPSDRPFFTDIETRSAGSGFEVSAVISAASLIRPDEFDRVAKAFTAGYMAHEQVSATQFQIGRRYSNIASKAEADEINESLEEFSTQRWSD